MNVTWTLRKLFPLLGSKVQDCEFSIHEKFPLAANPPSEMWELIWRDIKMIEGSSTIICFSTLLVVQWVSAVTQSCLTLCDPMDCSTPGVPVFHHLLEHAQTHVHWVGDAIQPSHPLSFSSPCAFNLSQHQGLSRWVGSLHQVAKVWQFQHQHQSFGWIFSTDILGWTGWISLQSKGLSRVLSRPQFKSINSLVLSFLYSPTLISIHNYWKNHSLDQTDLCWHSNVSAF